MNVGLYINDFALLNKITSKIKDKKIKLEHVNDFRVINNEIEVLISKSRIKGCKIPQIQPDNLDILELRIRLLGFFLIVLGSYLHVALDLMQIQLGQGVYLPYFPFSFETLQWNLFHINASLLLFPALLILVLAVWRLTR